MEFLPRMPSEKVKRPETGVPPAVTANVVPSIVVALTGSLNSALTKLFVGTAPEPSVGLVCVMVGATASAISPIENVAELDARSVSPDTLLMPAVILTDTLELIVKGAVGVNVTIVSGPRSLALKAREPGTFANPWVTVKDAPAPTSTTVARL